MTTQRTLRVTDEMVARARDAALGFADSEGCTSWNIGPRTVRKALEAALSPYLERRKEERRAGHLFDAMRRDRELAHPTQPKAAVETCGQWNGMERRDPNRQVVSKFRIQVNGMWIPERRRMDTGPSTQVGCMTDTQVGVETCGGVNGGAPDGARGLEGEPVASPERSCGGGVGPDWHHHQRSTDTQTPPPFYRGRAHRRVSDRDGEVKAAAATRTALKDNEQKTPPHIHVSREVTQAGLWAFHDDITGEYWRSQDRHAEMGRAYRAIRGREKKPGDCAEVENIGLSAYWGCDKPHSNWTTHERLKFSRAYFAMRLQELSELQSPDMGVR